jgi:hypothetical protein
LRLSFIYLFARGIVKEARRATLHIELTRRIYLNAGEYGDTRRFVNSVMGDRRSPLQRRLTLT